MASLACVRGLLLARTRPAGCCVTQVRHHLGYIPFEGRLGAYPTEKVKLSLELGRTNLQPVNKINYVFDPFTEDHYSLRNYMYHINGRKRKETNRKCIHKTTILDDRSSPYIQLDLSDGRQLELRTGNLTVREIASIVNNYVLPLVKEEEVGEAATKAAKGAGAGGKKGRK